MRICPSCGSQYPDDANFCPMDAAKLPEPVSSAASIAPAATIVDMPRPLAGRFLPEGLPVESPVGSMHRAVDLQGNVPVDVLAVETRALPTATIAERAVREARQLAKVKSDKILRVVDAVKHEDGRVYVATEPCKDPTLAQLVGEKGRLPLERAKEILLAVGEGLSEAQKVGVIHRDLSARNVLVGAERVRLGGFAVAEPVDERVFGAPGFLSPEQAEGKPVDQRSNIYSLGALFYYMVTGSPPFEGDGTPMSVVQQHLHAQPTPPSQRAPGLSAEVDKVVLKALEKSGGRRHLTLRQLLSEIETLTEAPPAPAPEPATAAKPGKKEAPVAKTIMAFAPGEALQAVIAEAQAAQSKDAGAKAAGASASASARPGGAAKAPAVAADGAGVRSNAEKLEAPEAAGAPAPTEAPVATSSPTATTASGDAPAPKVEPVKAEPRPEPARGPSSSGAKKKGGFRETAWFKRGELEEELAKQAAALSEKDPLAGTEAPQAVVDESTLTSEDRQRLSLKTGRTEMMQAIKLKPGVVPGDQMSDEEILAELDTSKKPMVFAGIGAAVLVILVAVYFLVIK